MSNHPQGNFKAGKATLYLTSEFFGNVSKVEVNEVRVVRRPWAQFSGAVVVTFRKPRQRKTREYVGSSKSYVVVLAGWGHPDPDDHCNWSVSETGLLVGQAKYLSCSDGYANDFDAKLAGYLAAHPEVKVLGDYRHTQGCNPYDAAASEPYLEEQRRQVTEKLTTAGVPASVATEAGRIFVDQSPERAAGFLVNDHNFLCSASGRSLVLLDGTRVQPTR